MKDQGAEVQWGIIIAGSKAYGSPVQTTFLLGFTFAAEAKDKVGFKTLAHRTKSLMCSPSLGPRLLRQWRV